MTKTSITYLLYEMSQSEADIRILIYFFNLVTAKL